MGRSPEGEVREERSCAVEKERTEDRVDKLETERISIRYNAANSETYQLLT